MGYVVGLADIGQAQVGEVGGKGANLGELGRIEGVRVPPGFCVTAGAYRQAVAAAPAFGAALDRLAGLDPEDREAIATASAQIRGVIERTPLPAGLVADLDLALAGPGAQQAWAVRSSATAEDLPGASFAGQQDSFLNVVGPAAVREHVRRCWASLFTERAVHYRVRNGFDHRSVQMAVVVQVMLEPTAAGILFTADPVTSNRRVATVDAVRGLGEALVSGVVNGDAYTVREEQVTARTVGTERVLTDAQLRTLVRLGRRVEAHFGHPQDIEWCLVGEDFQLVQSRPITTLFPLPATTDGAPHVYLSVGHQQMMTDAMRPLGLSLWQLTTPRPMAEAGGRLFVDVAAVLASPTGRTEFVEGFAQSDPLTGDALRTLLERGDPLPAAPASVPASLRAGSEPAPIVPDPALAAELVEQAMASLAQVEREITTRSGPELFDFILDDLGELKRRLFDPRGLEMIMAGMAAAGWLNSHLQEWLGERNVADTLSLSVPDNVTSQMGLALLDVADVMRPHPEVVAFLERVEQGTGGDAGFLDELASVAGGREARESLCAFLDRYGMRCAGEIDITRPRWRERPTTLVPTLLANIAHHEPGAGARRFERGRQQAEQKRAELRHRLLTLPDGQAKAEQMQRMVERVRAFTGYREFPKYGMVSRYLVYKQALLREAGRLLREGVVRDVEDVFYLRFEEFREAVRTNRVDPRLIRTRRAEFDTFQKLTPPRVFTADGEVITGAYRRDDLPPGALAGLAVSAGTVQGRARVVVDMARADLDPGDILVTAYTDPSWTPLFVGIAGLVTEVGGLMTHGAVIAREYGLPAVVGVPDATRRIRDGQLLRVHGTEGYVEVLAAPGG